MYIQGYYGSHQTAIRRHHRDFHVCVITLVMLFGIQVDIREISSGKETSIDFFTFVDFMRSKVMK